MIRIKTGEQLRPTGHRLRIPVLKSTKWPLLKGSSNWDMYHRLKLINFWTFSSPRCRRMLCVPRCFPDLNATNPFSGNKKSNLAILSLPPIWCVILPISEPLTSPRLARGLTSSRTCSTAGLMSCLDLVRVPSTSKRSRTSFRLPSTEDDEERYLRGETKDPWDSKAGPRRWPRKKTMRTSRAILKPKKTF